MAMWELMQSMRLMSNLEQAYLPKKVMDEKRRGCMKMMKVNGISQADKNHNLFWEKL